MFAIAKDVRKDHGDKRQGWPPDALDAVESAENTYNLAIASRDYHAADTRGLDSSVEDLVRELGKSKSMTVTAGRDAAALVLDVVSHRCLVHTAGVTDARCFIRLRIRPGPALDQARFRTASAQYRWCAEPPASRRASSGLRSSTSATTTCERPSSSTLS